MISESGGDKPLGSEGDRARSRSIKAADYRGRPCTIRRVAGLIRYDIRAAPLTEGEANAAAVLLRQGALAIYPTDTLYAVGCCARDGAALGLLRAAKGREEGKPFPVIVADIEQARSLSARWSDTAERLADAFWPGPLTLVVPASPDLPRQLLSGAQGVAVRVPACDVARTLARLAGPLVATSANLAGETPCQTVDLALRAFPHATLAFDAGPLDGAPSTLVDVTAPGGGFRILREGRVDAAALERAGAGRGGPR